MDERSLECPLCLDHYDSGEKKPMVFRCGRTICQDCVFGMAEYHYGKAFCGLSGCRCQLPPDQVPVNFSLLSVVRTAPALYNYVSESQSDRTESFDEASYPMSIDWMQQREEHFASSARGLIDFTKMLSQLLITCKNGCVSIAVIGGTGVGKSSLINALRDLVYPGFGLNTMDRNEQSPSKYAREGLSNLEASLIPRAYSFSDIQMVNLWDLPGYGTNSRLIAKRQEYLVDNLPETIRFHPNLYSCETYLEDVKVTMFDVYVLVISDRLSILDAKILEKLRERKVFLVRMKFDSILSSKPESMSVETFKAVLRGNTRSELESLYDIDWIRPDQIYLASRLVDDKVEGNDIMRLRDDLRACLETPKQVLFDLATGNGVARLKNLCDRVVHQRREVLLKEDLHWARLRAAGLSILPMGCVFVQKFVWKSYLKSFEKHFAIVGDCLERLAEVQGINKHELLNKLLRTVKQRFPATDLPNLETAESHHDNNNDEERLVNRDVTEDEEKFLHKILRRMNITMTARVVNFFIGLPIVSLPSNVYMSHAILNKAIERLSIMSIAAYHQAIDAVMTKVRIPTSRSLSSTPVVYEEEEDRYHGWNGAPNYADSVLDDDDSDFSWSKYDVEPQTDFSWQTVV